MARSRADRVRRRRQDANRRRSRYATTAIEPGDDTALRSGAGAIEWFGRDELRRSIRRDRAILIGIGVYCAIWLLALLEPPIDADTLIGVGFLEAFAVVPGVIAFRHLRRNIRRLEAADGWRALEDRELADDLAELDEVVDRLRDLTADVDGASARSAVGRAVSAAERAVRLERRLRRRRYTLGRLESRTRREVASDAIAEIDRECADLRDELEHLVAATVALTRAADDDEVAEAVVELGASSERITALCEAVRELAEPDTSSPAPQSAVRSDGDVGRVRRAPPGTAPT